MVFGGSLGGAGDCWRDRFIDFLCHADGMGAEKEVPLAVPSLILSAVRRDCDWLVISPPYCALAMAEKDNFVPIMSTIGCIRMAYLHSH
jgi:hypothetical protein